MAPCKTEQPLEPSSVAAPVAVGRANAKDASRCSSACPVGSSLTQPKVTFLGSLRTLSLETYWLIQGNYHPTRRSRQCQRIRLAGERR
jgi:hypothetical protein